MPRGVKKEISVDQQIIDFEEKIKGFDKKVEVYVLKKKEILKQIASLKKQKEEADYADLAKVLKESGKTPEELKKIIGSK